MCWMWLFAVLGVMPSARATCRVAADLLLQHQCGGLGGARRPVRAVLDQHLVGVGGGQDPRGRGERIAGHAAWVAGPVESFLVQGGQPPDVPQQRGPGQDPFGVVGVQPQLLLLVQGQRTLVVPHVDRDRGPAQVVHEPGPTYPGDFRGREGGPGRGPRREAGHRAGVTGGVQRLKVGEVGHYLQRAVKLLTPQHHRRPRIGRDHVVPHRR